MWAEAFTLSNLAVSPAWAALVGAAALGDRAPMWLMAFPKFVAPAALSLSYAAIVATEFSALDGGFESLDAVRALFASEPAVLAGWQHFLAFDLIVGALSQERMAARRVSFVIQAPVLALCFLFGPIGFLLALAATSGADLAKRAAQ